MTVGRETIKDQMSVEEYLHLREGNLTTKTDCEQCNHKDDLQDGGSSHFDEVLEAAGSWGRWQKFIFFITYFSQVFCAMHAVSAAFLSATPKHWCKVPGQEEHHDAERLRNISIPWSTDTGYSKCDFYNHNYTYLLPHMGPTFMDTDEFSFDDQHDNNLLQKLLPDHKPAPGVGDMAVSFSNTTSTCTSWIFDDSVFESTLVSEYSLVCHRLWMMATVQASFMCGLLFGSLIMGQLSDRFGRRPTTMICAFSSTILGICSSFVDSYMMFIALRFLMGFVNAGVMVIAFVIVMEVVKPSARTMTGMMYSFFFGLGIAILPGFAYFIRHWRDLQLAISLASSVLFSYYWILPESPRWLVSQGRTKEALRIFKTMAKVNRRVLPSDDEVLGLLTNNKEKFEDEEEPDLPARRNKWIRSLVIMLKNQGSLMRTPVMRRRSYKCFFIWLVGASAYYGLIFSGGNINADPFLMIFVSGIVELPSALIFIYFMNKFGRRPVMCFLYCGTAACCLLVLAVPRHMVYISFLLVSLGKFFNTSGFQMAYLYTSELMPTPVRNLSVGTCSMFARIGCIITPYVITLLGDLHYALPSALFGVLCMAAGLLSLLLPETNKTALPESIAQVEATPK